MNDKKDIDFKMLDALRKKEQWVITTERETGKKLTAAREEVRRQIAQVLVGKKVTKSDGSFGSD